MPGITVSQSSARTNLVNLRDPKSSRDASKMGLYTAMIYYIYITKKRNTVKKIIYKNDDRQ